MNPFWKYIYNEKYLKINLYYQNLIKTNPLLPILSHFDTQNYIISHLIPNNMKKNQKNVLHILLIELFFIAKRHWWLAIQSPKCQVIPAFTEMT
jgi:hypothetical protein